MTITLHCVIKGLGDDAPIQGLHRVLWINKDKDILVTIEIPTWTEDQGPPRYYKGPRKQHWSEIYPHEDLGNIVVVQNVESPPLMGMTDDEIRKEFPQREGEMKRKRPRTDCAILQARDTHWIWALPIIKFVDDSRQEAFETEALGERILARAVELGRKKNEIYDVVHRVLAHAAREQSLLTTLPRCGGKGKSRTPRKVSRLGPVNAAYKQGKVPSPGIHLSAEDKRHIAMGHSKFVGEGKSVREAHLLTLGAWWSTGSKLDDGVELPILKPAHQCPTLAQFRYWGVMDPEGKSAFELLLKSDEWERNFRAMLGTAMDGLTGVGQMGVLDATGIKTNFVTSESFLEATGPGHRIVVHEGMDEIITGFYVGLEAPSERTALLAVLNSAMDKVELFSRFDLTITSRQVPAVFYRKLRADNGELRNEGTIQTLQNVGTALEYVQRRRAERKQQAESGHRSIQRLLDEKIDGATQGGSPERGEDHSAIPACWTWFAYKKEFLRAVIYYNCYADATSLMRRHPFRTEMALAEVPAHRADIHAWCVENNKLAMPAHDLDHLRVKLLPRYRATVKQNGIFLLRPDRSEDKSEIVWGPRFSGPRAMELRWHEGARRDFHIDIRMDPNSPNRIWYADSHGLHSFDNLSNDQLMKRELTLYDILAMQDSEHVSKLVSQSEANQAASDYMSHRENVNLTNRAAKRAEIKATGGKVSKTRLKSGISENRAKEAAYIASTIDPVTRMPRSPTAPAKTSPKAGDGLTAGEATVPIGHKEAQQAACTDPTPSKDTDSQAQPCADVAAGAGWPTHSVVSASLAAFRERRSAK